jgi:hypothetical protein
MLYKQLTLALIMIGAFAAGIETALPAEFKLASRFQDSDGADVEIFRGQGRTCRLAGSIGNAKRMLR